jgi:hypothetical protein
VALSAGQSSRVGEEVVAVPDDEPVEVSSPVPVRESSLDRDVARRFEPPSPTSRVVPVEALPSPDVVSPVSVEGSF